MQRILWIGVASLLFPVGCVFGVFVERRSAPTPAPALTPTQALAPTPALTAQELEQQEVLRYLAQHGTDGASIKKWGPKAYFQPRVTDARGNFLRHAGPGYYYRPVVLTLKTGEEKSMTVHYDGYDEVDAIW